MKTISRGNTGKMFFGKNWSLCLAVVVVIGVSLLASSDGLKLPIEIPAIDKLQDSLKNKYKDHPTRANPHDEGPSNPANGEAPSPESEGPTAANGEAPPPGSDVATETNGEAPPPGSDVTTETNGEAPPPGSEGPTETNGEAPPPGSDVTTTATGEAPQPESDGTLEGDILPPSIEAPVESE